MTKCDHPGSRVYFLFRFHSPPTISKAIETGRLSVVNGDNAYEAPLSYFGSCVLPTLNGAKLFAQDNR